MQSTYFVRTYSYSYSSYTSARVPRASDPLTRSAHECTCALITHQFITSLISSSLMSAIGSWLRFDASCVQPSFQISLPAGCRPLLVFINPKSGGKQGLKYARSFVSSRLASLSCLQPPPPIRSYPRSIRQRSTSGIVSVRNFPVPAAIYTIIRYYDVYVYIGSCTQCSTSLHKYTNLMRSTHLNMKTPKNQENMGHDTTR